MERLRKAGRISGYQMRMALGNKRMRMIILILLLFVVQTLLPVRSFCGDIHVAAAPVAFVFLVNDYICQFLIIAGAVMLFSDAPFENEGYLYMLPRAGRISWGLGRIFYIFRIAFLYVGCLMAATILPLVGYLSIQEGWGKIWGTLAKTDASLVYGLEFSVPEMIVSRYTPVEALTVSFLLELACIIWIGLFVYAGNKISRKPLGTVAGVFFTLLDICISNDWLEDAYACSPVSLAQLTTYSGYALKYHIDLRYGVCFFIIGIAVLSGLCIILNKSERKGKWVLWKQKR